MSHTLAEDFATVRKCIVNDPNEPRWITARAALDAIEQRMGELAERIESGWMKGAYARLAELQQAENERDEVRNFLSVSERERRLGGMREATLRARVETLTEVVRGIAYDVLVDSAGDVANVGTLKFIQRRAAAILSEGGGA